MEYNGTEMQWRNEMKVIKKAHSSITDNGRLNGVPYPLVAILFWWKPSCGGNIIQFSVPAVLECRDKFGGDSVIIQSEGLVVWLTDCSLPVKWSKDRRTLARGHINPLKPIGYPSVFHSYNTQKFCILPTQYIYIYVILCCYVWCLKAWVRPSYWECWYQVVEIIAAWNFYHLCVRNGTFWHLLISLYLLTAVGLFYLMKHPQVIRYWM